MALEPPEFIPTKSYAFSKLRALIDAMPIAQGVVEGVDMQVLQREAGSNMSIDILPGDVWVKGESIARQGMYHTYNTVRSNVLVPAASSSNPRVDQVIVAVHDSSVIGSSDSPEFRVIEGTASAGTQITDPTAVKYRLGARSDAEIRALHPNFVRLADILVRTSTTDVKTSDIMDRRGYSGTSPLTVTARGGNFIASSGERARINGTTTVFLPAPTTSFYWEGWSEQGGAVKIKAPSGVTIYGDFIVAQETITLGQYQHVALASNGASYLIVGGEPKQEAKWSTRTGSTVNSPHLISATRNAYVALSIGIPKQAPTIEAQMWIGGRQVSQWAIVEKEESGVVMAGPFFIPVGQEWELKVAGGWSVSESHIIL